METKYRFKDAATVNRKVVVQIMMPDGTLKDIYFTNESGRVVTRMKIDTITKVRHTGLCLGSDENGELWIAHNHYKKKRPVIDSFAVYAIGEKVDWDGRDVHYTREQIVERTVKEVLRGKSYDYANYNCQTFINRIVSGKIESEDVDKITNGVAITGGVLALIGLLTGNRRLAYTGLAIGGVALGVKVYSRTDW